MTRSPNLAPDLAMTVGPTATLGCRELAVGRVGEYYARVRPDKLAIEDGMTRLTYAELDTTVNRLASALVALGVRKGDVISAYLPNCLTYVLVVLAVARAGGVFSPINPRFKAREIGDILAVAKPKIVFTTAGRIAIMRDGLDRVGGPSVEVIAVDGSGKRDGALGIDSLLDGSSHPLPVVGEDDYFSLMFTSGTTGKPKGALATHRARMLWVLNAAILYGLGANDVYLGTMPQVHSAGLTFTLMHLYAGGTIEILTDFDARRYLEVVEERHVTSSLMVPTMLTMVLEELDAGGRTYDLRSLRRLVTCGSPLPRATKEKVLARMTSQLFDYYGSTESNSMTVLMPDDQLRKPASVGQAFPNVEIRIAGGDGTWLSPGNVGEVWCRNPSVMSGYLGQPEATAAVFRDGWYRTGDLGYLDQEGYLHLVGRSTEVIISGGINIYPAEIEQVLMEHPGVLDCAVTGEPDPKWGQRIVAYIVVRGGWPLDQAQIQAHCARTLADYKKPRRVEFVREIPKNAGGKTIKAALTLSNSEQQGA
jgi:acyl-CoA synthetase (AMP-forming)/AMP-acid ligase II